VKNYWPVIGGVLAFLGVAAGAFGSHSLKDYLTPEMTEIYKTGVFYHLIHSLAVFAVGLYGSPRFYKSAAFFTAGVILFSFSLYTYALTGNTVFAMVTPLGGVCFLTGWLLTIISSVNLNKKH
jgi:uncharacterized membrane protein YgdD (TMEM256/DUF423 family)